MRSILILLLIPIIANSDTTGNLLNQQFYDGNKFANGWSGTNDHNHGNSIVAGVDKEYIENSISLQNDAGLSKGIINNGFTSTAGADIWFWNQIEQNVEITQTLVDDNGNVTTQTKTINNDGCYYCTHNDSIVIGSNSQEDYEITVRYTFNENSNSTYHYGADLRNPTLFIEYDPVVLSTVQKTEINTAVEKVEEIEIKEYKFEEVKVDIIEEEIKVEEVKFEEEIKLDEKEFVEENIVLSTELNNDDIIQEDEKTTELNNDDIIQEDEKTEEELEEGCSGCTENETTEVVQETSRDADGVETRENNSRSVEASITVDEVLEQVSQQTDKIDVQLQTTQIIVAKQMQKKNQVLNQYNNVNSDIFKQIDFPDANIDSYLYNTYVDIRNIYSNIKYEDRNGY
jgi:hypothetical protein